MSDNVIDLAAARENRTPHVSGPCVCLHCKHEWVMVAPTEWARDRMVFDCPECTLEKAVWAGIHRPEECWTCECGNRFMLLGIDGAMCPLCRHFWTWSEFGGTDIAGR